MWPMLALAGASALMGGITAREQAKTQRAQNLAAAEQTRNSPWTNMGAGQLQSGAPSAMAGALQGGLGGAMQGMSMMGTNKANKLAEESAAQAAAKHELDMKLAQQKFEMAEAARKARGY